MTTEMAPQHPAILLMQPQMGENIGAAARAMCACGFSDLRLIAPRDGWPNDKAWPLAAGATQILEDAKVFPDLVSACSDLSMVWATTARPRDQIKTVQTPKAAASAYCKAPAMRSGLLFGPERSGLDNESVSMSQAVISLPLNPEFSSLNLAQAVMVVCWEFHCYLSNTEEEFREQTPYSAPIHAATLQDWDHMLTHLFTELEDSGFFFPAEKKPSMELRLRNMFVRSGWTPQEVRTFRGLIKSLKMP